MTWTYWPFRVAITLAALMMVLQAVLAGQFLAGTYQALGMHRDNATYAGIMVLVAAACALLIWRPGRGPFWPFPATLALFGLIAVQIMLGFGRVLAVHIPLGLAIIALCGRLALWSWQARPASVAVSA